MSKFPSSAPGLRERNKAKRRDAILDAALSTLDHEATVELNVERVAQVAEVSLATVYNLVGGRDEILRQVAERVAATVALDVRARLDDAAADPLAPSRMSLELSAARLTQRSLAFRRVIAHLGGLGADALALQRGDGTPLDAADVHIVSMRRAQRAGLVRRGLDPGVLGVLVANAHNGALLRWSYGGTSDAQLGPLSSLGLVTVAASACTAAHRARFERELAALQRQVTTAPS